MKNIESKKTAYLGSGWLKPCMDKKLYILRLAGAPLLRAPVIDSVPSRICLSKASEARSYYIYSPFDT